MAQAVDYGSGEGGVRVARAEFGGDPEGRVVYEPDHPLANEEGYVRYPDIDLGDQMVAADDGPARLPGEPRRRRAGHQRLPGRPAAREGLTMTSPLGGILPVGIGAVTGVAGATDRRRRPAQNADGFASILASSFDQLQGTQKTADTLATQAATGDLKDVHDYMIASNEASLATEMVVTIKNKAVEAFNEIMRMPV